MKTKVILIAGSVDFISVKIEIIQRVPVRFRVRQSRGQNQWSGGIGKGMYYSECIFVNIWTDKSIFTSLIPCD